MKESWLRRFEGWVDGWIEMFWWGKEGASYMEVVS